MFALEGAGITLGLAQIRALVSRLGHPEEALTVIIVAGTNGKGSVTAMVERGLRAAGCRTGRYTSPHLIDINERVVIDGIPVSDAAFDRATGVVREASATMATPPTFFEATTAIAFVAFREAGVGVAVLEVGLGGRLDATNVTDAPLVAITNIGLDHQAFLGDTIEAIAVEKAGVIKPGASVVIGRTSDAAIATLTSAAAHVGAHVTYAPDGVRADAVVTSRTTQLTLQTPTYDYGTVQLALLGAHQVDNAITAVRTLEAANRLGIARVAPAAIKTALSDAIWPGRLDWRTWQGCDVLVDGAHNADGARALSAFLRDTVRTPLPIVFGIMRDKTIADVLLALAPTASSFVFTASGSGRAASAQELGDLAAQVVPSVPCAVAASPHEALTIASQRSRTFVVSGSLLLAGDVLALLA